MGLKRNSPGCKCCCIVWDDQFGRADASDPGDRYDVAAGSVPLASNKLTPGANALFTCDKELPTTYDMHVEVVGRTNTAGDVVRVVADYVDADNYFFADFLFSNFQGLRSVQIGDRDAGSETILAEARIAIGFGVGNLALNSDARLNLVVCSDRMVAWVDAGGFVTPAAGVPVTRKGGVRGGAGTRAVTGAVSIDDFYLMKTSWDSPFPYDSPRCAPQKPCGRVTEGMGPRQVKIVLAGFSGIGTLCGGDDTSEFNGTHYTTNFWTSGFLVDLGGCFYGLSPITTITGGAFCTGGSENVPLTCEFKTGNVIEVVLQTSKGTTTFSKTMGGPIDSWTLTNEDIPLISDGHGSTGTPTCTITSIPL